MVVVKEGGATMLDVADVEDDVVPEGADEAFHDEAVGQWSAIVGVDC